ncbi:EAL domain-containing protein [Leeia sp. TBRC 13508]|uniref:EAL domain-containing protein n=1 Tax=Leeia speluncae TaxID=2884804 RepID=A0ABS8D8X4_9NEIS|nr:EAL domain-containing protein [Leeia speluncae]MCB6184672.1 EAL domain-containing protein [Leeia speluncae]
MSRSPSSENASRQHSPFSHLMITITRDENGVLTLSNSTGTLSPFCSSDVCVVPTDCRQFFQVYENVDSLLALLADDTYIATPALLNLFLSNGDVHQLHLIPCPEISQAGLHTWKGLILDISQSYSTANYHQTLLDNTPYHIWMKDIQGRLLASNQYYASQFGLSSPTELVGKTDFEIHTEEHAKKFQEDDQRVIQSAKAISVEESYLDDNGNIAWAETHKSPVIVDGKVIGTVGYSRDITERKLLEDHLFLNEFALAHAKDAVFISDATQNHRFIYVNKAACEHLQYDKDELLSHTQNDICPEFSEIEIQRLARTDGKSTETGLCYETDYRRKDGSFFPVEVHSTILQYQGQTLFFLIAQDITEQRKTQTDLYLNKFILDLIQDAVYLISTEAPYHFVHVNQRALEYLQYSREELSGFSPLDIDPNLSGPTQLRQILSGLKADETLSFETSHQRKDGSTYPVEVRTRLVSYQGTNLSLAIATDLTERKISENKLLERQQFLQSLQNSIPIPMYYKDLLGVYHGINQACRDFFGFSDDDIVGKTNFDIFTEQTASLHRSMDNTVLHLGTSIQYDDKLPNAQGELRDLRFHKALYRDQEGTPQGIICAYLDMTEQRKAEKALTEREYEYRTLVENTSDMIARFDLDLKLRYANPAFVNAYARKGQNLIGQSSTEIFETESHCLYSQLLIQSIATKKELSTQYKWLDDADHENCAMLTFTPEVDRQGKVSSILVVGRDITEQYEYQQKTHQMAYFDQLTGLANRAHFNEMLKIYVSTPTKEGDCILVTVLDMDRFKEVNDSLGHPVGDQLLASVAERLKQQLPTHATLARLGGDEFAILIPVKNTPETIEPIANIVLEAFKTPFPVSGYELHTSCSIGISRYPVDSDNADDLIRFADVAMYEAKKAGRNCFAIYTEALSRQLDERMEMESELRQALSKQEFALFYQPKICLKSGKTIGSEALLRWIHPSKGIISPLKFIPLAEECGLIVEIGKWVIGEACKMAVRWNQVGEHKVAINLSAKQFQSETLVADVKSMMEATGCHPDWIELEITESLLLEDDVDVLHTLKQFRDAGISIAIDDFGTGYSSLSYLAKYPIDTLKIDRSFINSIQTDPQRAGLVKAIFSIARCLNQSVVAEGVETQDQLDFLTDLDCEYAQGYLFSMPVNAESLEQNKEWPAVVKGIAKSCSTSLST